jgi:hypothetical protein
VTTTLDDAATRLAALLMGAGGGLADPTGADLEFEAEIVPRALPRRPAPPDIWAVDGGQALVADARCLQVLVTRASRVRFRGRECLLEDEGELRAHLLGGLDQRVAALVALGLPLPADTAVDVNLLRDRWEWDAVERSIEEAQRGGVVLIDGDLQPDWRIPSSYLAHLIETANDGGVTLVAITKHSSLSRGGAPLLGQLEIEADNDPRLGERSTWWTPVARTRTDVAAGIQVVAAKLDPDARFAFRVDLPADADPEVELGRIAAVSDDAAFPGYPYPLSVADRVASCPGWLRQEIALRLDELLDEAGVPPGVRERAFTDRHDLMERA